MPPRPLVRPRRNADRSGLLRLLRLLDRRPESGDRLRALDELPVDEEAGRALHTHFLSELQGLVDRRRLGLVLGAVLVARALLPGGNVDLRALQVLLALLDDVRRRH